MELTSKSLDSTSYSGTMLSWNKLNVYVKDKKNKNHLKRIINNTSGTIQRGKLIAVMGSSGAGKSTLMSALAHRNMSGTIIKGNISVNGRPIGSFMHRSSGFIHQDDLFDGALTVLEHLNFIANLKLDRRMKRQEKANLVTETLAKVGLLQSRNTLIGDTNKGKTLSGGEKKRLSFAAELLTNPKLLFCDEPTTGLDAYSAQQLIKILLRLTKQGTTIMCTIHQPSSQIFDMFHSVLLLTEGRICFNGRPSEAISFFSRNGFCCPPSYNPADFLIGVMANTQMDKDNQSVSNKLCDAYEASNSEQPLEVFDRADFIGDNQSEVLKPYWISIVFFLIHRNLLIIIRDPTIQKLRIFQKIAISIMAGLCFFGTIDLTQYGIQSVQGVLFILISENTFTPMYSALSIFPQRNPIYQRERQAGLYNTFQYYITSVFALIPGLILEPLIFTMICYWLAGLKATSYAFFMTALIIILVMNIATACGCFFSILFKSVDVAIAYLVPFDVSLMITSGVFIRLNSIPFFLTWLKYLSWLKYANEAMTIVQWEGVKNISCVTDDSQLPCLRTDIDIFDQYSFSENNLSIDFYALIALYFTFNILSFVILWVRSRKL